MRSHSVLRHLTLFQSSFELTGYITKDLIKLIQTKDVSKLFRAYRLYNVVNGDVVKLLLGFKALSSLQVI